LYSVDAVSMSLGECTAALAIMRVFSTSKGFPAMEPMAPAAEPAANLNTKCESLFTPMACLMGAYRPSLRDV
jgi:hypothetical protein